MVSPRPSPSRLSRSQAQAGQDSNAMKQIGKAIAGAMLTLALMSSPLPASAQVLAKSIYYKVTSPGSDVTMGMFYGVNPDCSSTGDYHIHLLIAPKGGQIFIDKHAGYPDYPATNVRSACNRRKLIGTRMIYQANPTFTGIDAFTVEVVYPNQTAVRQIYGVKVE